VTDHPDQLFEVSLKLKDSYFDKAGF